MNLFSPLSIPKKYIVGKNMMQEITTVKHSLKIFGSIRCCTRLPVNAAVAITKKTVRTTFNKNGITGKPVYLFKMYKSINKATG